MNELAGMVAGKTAIVAQDCQTGHEIAVIGFVRSCVGGPISYNVRPESTRDANAYAVSDTHRVLYP